MQLSKRLETVAGLVSSGNRAADIGTDHGYIPIYLVWKNICPRVIAMDMNKGPLQRAKEHVLQHGLESCIETRLSDGVCALREYEADTLIIAGMGGNVIIHILEKGWHVIKKMRECIIQPQSEIVKLRHYLADNGYQIVKEDMVEEDGKYYPMMKVIPNRINTSKKDREIYFMYGKLLLQDRNMVLKQFLEKELSGTQELLKNLKSQIQHTAERVRELEHKEQLVLEALAFYRE